MCLKVHFRSFLLYILVIVSELGHCVSCLVELKGGGKLTKSTWRICSLCDLLYCYKCVENFPLRFSPNQVCKADVCKSCFRVCLFLLLIP